MTGQASPDDPGDLEVRAATLDALYARLPRLVCRGRCSDSCTDIGLSPAEQERISAVGYNIPSRSTLTATGQPCPALNLFGACAVYNLRPMICRLYGMMEGRMRCPHGCVPEGGFLDPLTGFRLLTDAMLAGGAIDEAQHARMVDLAGTPVMSGLLVAHMQGAPGATEALARAGVEARATALRETARRAARQRNGNRRRRTG